LADPSRIRFYSSQLYRKISVKPVVILTLILAGYLFIEFFLPLGTAIQIGGDEGFELAKATLCLKGYNLYTDIWNDQPPLHTFLITQTLKHVSTSVLGPRLISVGFAIILLGSAFMIFLRAGSLFVAGLATALIIASPGFITLSASCMLEIPALSLAILAICVLCHGTSESGHLRAVLAGIILGLSVQIKLIGIIMLPLVAIILWLQYRRLRDTLVFSLLVVLTMVSSFSITDCLIERGAFLAHFQQTWASHFGGVRSSEYGSPEDYPFDWKMLARNWDVAVCGLVGAGFVVARSGRSIAAIFPVTWLVLELSVFTCHKPWWSYYYLHISLPLCWCAAIGIENLYQSLWPKRIVSVVISAFIACALAWMGGRVYLQICEVRTSPQTYDDLILQEIKPYQPFTKWLYADKNIYSFHTGIPLPPPLAVVMLKRMWSGEMTNGRISEEMERYHPELILLANDGRIMPFQNLISREYKLVYQDTDFRLYVLRTIITKTQL